MKLPPLSKTVWRKSGWGYTGRSKYRGYVTVFSSVDNPVTTYLTVRRALEFIRQQEAKKERKP